MTTQDDSLFGKTLLRRIKRALVAGCLTGTALSLSWSITATSPQAEACVNGVEKRVNDKARMVSMAERRLRRGQHVEALKAIKSLRGMSPSLMKRARRVQAVAVIQTKGSVAKDGDAPIDASHRADQIGWAIRTLEGQRTRRLDPRLNMQIAEGLLLVPERRAEGRKLLEELARRDVMPDARGYAILADLRAEAGDKDGSAEAVKRCQRLGGDDAFCEPDEAASPAKDES